MIDLPTTRGLQSSKEVGIGVGGALLIMSGIGLLALLLNWMAG